MSDAPRPLADGESIEDRLLPGTPHTYEISVAKDELVHLVAEQRGLDVRLLLFDPSGRQLAEVDSLNGAEGTEEVTEVAEAGGTYRLQVLPVDGDAPAGAGTYRLRIAERRPATFTDRLLLAAERAFESAEGCRRRGETRQALGSYRLAAELWREVSDARGDALATYRMGWMEDELGRLEAADAHYRLAMERLGEGGDPALRGAISNRWGRNLLVRGLAESRAAHERAYQLFHALRDPAGQAASLHNLGKVYAALRAGQRARECYEMAIALWTQVGNAGEEAKTRRYLAGLPPSPGPLDGAAATPAREPGAAVAAAAARPNAARGPASLGDRQGEVVALAALGAALAREGRLDEAANRYARIFAPALEAGTLVLWYEVGDDRTNLWTVGPGGRASHCSLPGRAEVEAAARRLFELAPRDDAESAEPRRRAAADLSRMLLAPAARELTARRLVLVVAGPLEWVPFAMLPEPEGVGGPEAAAGAPLLARHDLVILSPAILPAALGRRRRPQREAPHAGPAVVGDPVLRRDDSRLGPAQAGAAGPPAARGSELDGALLGLGLDEPPALPFSRQEAEAVAALLPESNRCCAFGFDATPEQLSSLAGQYRMLHVAALALLSPRGSGLMLSLYDRHGGPRPGFLPLADLARLDLPLNLLVVTGSRAMWEAEGGGLGLARAAMAAGAARVVTSLWSAEDESAVELIRCLYQGVLEKRLDPASALRQAQEAVAADPRWRAPRHWAGFMLTGAWDVAESEDSRGLSEGTIEAADKGGTGGNGKPDNDYPPPHPPATGETGSGA